MFVSIPRPKQKARSSLESPGFVVLPRMTDGLRHRHPPGDKAILWLAERAGRQGARELARSGIDAHVMKIAFHFRVQIRQLMRRRVRIVPNNDAHVNKIQFGGVQYADMPSALIEGVST